MLSITRVGSISVRQITSKSGVTSPTHFVCKNAAFDVELVSSGSLLLNRAALELSLVYDGRAPPYKPVDFAGKKVVVYAAAGVSARAATLQVRVGVLSSQVEGALFRVQIEAAVDGVRHSALTPPLTVVSKPYLALRKSGERGKPKPLNKRHYEDVSKKIVIATVDSPETVDGGELLNSLDSLRQEQVKARRMLEQLLRNQQTMLVSDRAFVKSDDDDDAEYVEEGDDDVEDDDEDEQVVAQVKRSRRGFNAKEPATEEVLAAPSRLFVIDSSDISDSPPPPLMRGFDFSQPFPLEASCEKKLEAAAEALAHQFQAFAAMRSEQDGVAIIRRVLPESMLRALGTPTLSNQSVCHLFLNGCEHERELNELRKRELFSGLGDVDVAGVTFN